MGKQANCFACVRVKIATRDFNGHFRQSVSTCRKNAQACQKRQENAGVIFCQQTKSRGGAQTNFCGGKNLVEGDSSTHRQIGNEVIGSPATRARQPFLGEISSRFEFSKAKSGLFLKKIKKFVIIIL